MTAKACRLQPGVYAPILTPFSKSDTEEINYPAFEAAVSRLAEAGVGLVVSGTLGEGPLLTREEKKTLVQTAKKVLEERRLDGKIPIIAGIGGGSVKETIASAVDAADAGADAVLVVPTSYYAFVMGKNREALSTFFKTIADRSPIPVLLYNIPFATGGIDLDADFLIDISEHQNIAFVASDFLTSEQLTAFNSGVKLTCYNISKGHRVALHVNSPEYKKRHPLPFLVLPGGSDYMLSGLVSRQHGCVGGPANLYPKVCMRLFTTATRALETGDMALFREAQELQDILTEADSVINRVGFLGIKTAIDIHVTPDADVEYLGGAFRAPLYAASNSIVQDVTHNLKRIFELENSL
ncbi:hypothetical protein F5884DRAFT_872584 [Xylogone sp. PMI_703]|nr:hypothetical protein F5884DRAFT_872584 [Xylogone sp. PMI_703]